MLRFGSKEQKDRVAKDVLMGRKYIALAISEAGVCGLKQQNKNILVHGRELVKTESQHYCSFFSRVAILKNVI